MASGIMERDFIFGQMGDGKDWHGLTQEVADCGINRFPTLREEAIQTASGIILPDWKCLVASDDNQMCGEPFTSSFGYITPQQAWAMVEEALSGTKFTIRRVGTLNGRCKWFVSVYLDELAEVANPGEKFEVVVCGGLDRKLSPQAQLSHIRVVCMNTLRLALAQGDEVFRVRQVGNSKEMLAAAKSQVENMIGMARVFTATLDSLKTKPVDKDTARLAYAGEVKRNKGDFAITYKNGKARENRSRNTVDELTELFASGMGNEGKNRLDVLNGLTQLFTRGNQSEKSTKNPRKQFESSEFGGYADRKQRFFLDITNDDSFDELVDEGKEALATV